MFDFDVSVLVVGVMIFVIVGVFVSVILDLKVVVFLLELMSYVKRAAMIIKMRS